MRCYNGNIRCTLFVSLFFLARFFFVLEIFHQNCFLHTIRLNWIRVQFYLSFKFQIFEQEKQHRKKKNRFALKLFVPFFLSFEQRQKCLFLCHSFGLWQCTNKNNEHFLVFISLTWYMRKRQGGSMCVSFFYFFKRRKVVNTTHQHTSDTHEF